MGERLLHVALLRELSRLASDLITCISIKAQKLSANTLETGKELTDLTEGWMRLVLHAGFTKERYIFS